MKREGGDTTIRSYQPWQHDKLLSKSMNTVYGYVTIIDHLGSVIEACGPPREDWHEDSSAFTPEDVTYLKLLMVCTYARTCFLPIASKWTKKLRYMDILSASGLTYRREEPSPAVAGSAFLTPLARQDFGDSTASPDISFSEVHCFDYSRNNLDLLLKRRKGLIEKAGFALPEYHAHSGDANAAVVRLVEKIAASEAHIRNPLQRSLTLAFIDNQALDITMETIRAIQVNIRADLIVHIPVRAIWRSIEASKATQQEQAKLDAFFGGDAWRDIDTPDDIPRVYHEAIRNVTGVDFQEFDPIMIRGKNTNFALGFYVRKTSGLNPNRRWMDAITKVAEACNQLDHKTFQDILNRTQRGQQPLSEWF